MESAIVITGISGKFPNSDGIYQFRENLFNKTDLVTDDERRWPKFHSNIPKKSGKLFGIEHFDYGFFGVSKKTADSMEAMTRLTLERVYEALVDAGHHPFDFEKEKCGVYVATTTSENPLLSAQQNIVYYFKLNGPSFVTDAACSGSLVALEAAYNHLKEGVCNKAIVCGLNICLDPFLTLQFTRLGLLSSDGVTKCFAQGNDGYTRSEAIVAVVLEKKSEAKRIYAELIHCRNNCDGYKEEGITFPSSEMQRILIKEFYNECKIDPTSLTYIEAHATGTKVGDPQELDGLKEVLCKNRLKPLLLGSVKSNMGHSEPASGLCSLIKAIIGMESGFVPPNLHYTDLKHGLRSLENCQLKIVVEKTPWPENNVLAGINSFGFGGSNGHALLRWNTKQNRLDRYDCNMPKIICISGRTQEAVESIFQDILSRAFNPEFAKLLHQVYRKPIDGNIYHGCVIFKNGISAYKKIKKISTEKRHLCIILNEFSKERHAMLQKTLQQIPKYDDKFKKTRTLIRQNFNVKELDDFLIQLTDGTNQNSSDNRRNSNRFGIKTNTE